MHEDHGPTKVLTIGNLARETGASVRSLRHYDAHGLLRSTRRVNGYRVFAPAAIAQVRQVRRLLAAGFSVAEIRTFPTCMLLVVGGGVCPQTAATQRRRLALLERQITDLERRRARLRRMLTEGIISRVD